MIDHKDFSHNNSQREIVALKVDRITNHGQKEVNLKTIKVQPWKPDLFFSGILSERSINYWRHMIPILSMEKSWPPEVKLFAIPGIAALVNTVAMI